jgi:hypothetical protein
VGERQYYSFSHTYRRFLFLRPKQHPREFNEYVGEAAIIIHRVGSIQRGALDLELNLGPTMIDRILEAVIYQSKGDILLINRRPRDCTKGWIFTKAARDKLDADVDAEEAALAARIKAEEDAIEAARTKRLYDKRAAQGLICQCGEGFDSNYQLVYEHIEKPGELDLSKPHGKIGEPPRVYYVCSCGFASMDDWRLGSHTRGKGERHKQVRPEVKVAA